MARNGSGTYVRTDGVRTGSTVFAQEQAAGINILATNLDTEAQDMADALTQSLSKDGQTVPTANLPMGGYKHTNVADATADNQYASKGQMDTAIAAVSPMGLEWKNGLLCSNGTDANHDIDIAVGSIMDTTNVYRMNLTSAFTKRIDATFAVGTTNGGLSVDDALGNNTWYGVFLLSKSTDPDDCDVIFATTKAKSLSDAVAGAAGFDISRLIGYVLTDGSANIIAFKKGGYNAFIWNVMDDSYSSTESTAGASITLRCPPNQTARVHYSITTSDGNSTTSGSGILTQINQTNTAPTDTVRDIGVANTATGATATQIRASIVRDILTDSSSQIRHRETSEVDAATILTIGYSVDYTVTDLV
jgi:hypothetical protein